MAPSGITTYVTFLCDFFPFHTHLGMVRHDQGVRREVLLPNNILPLGIISRKSHADSATSQTFVDSWFGYFVKKFSNDTNFVDPNSPVPTFDAIAPIVEDIYTRLFAIILGLNPTLFEAAPPSTMIQGTMLARSPRIILSRPALIITVALLTLNIIVVVAYYIRRPKKMLRQMPITIASVLELFDGSGLVTEARNRGGVSEEWKIGYGRFVGTNGKPKVGIERRPFVVPWGDG